MRPSEVFLGTGATEREDDRLGGYGEGIEEADVRAGWFRRPSGSFRFDASRRTVPVSSASVLCLSGGEFMRPYRAPRLSADH
jgi:hypothetical protein